MICKENRGRIIMDFSNMNYNEICNYIYENITSNKKSISDLLEYLTHKYDAKIVTATDEQLNIIKNNVVMLHYQHLLSKTKKLDINTKKHEKEDMIKIMNDRTKQINDLTINELGLNIYVLAIVKSDRSIKLFENIVNQYKIPINELKEEVIWLEIEEKNEYISTAIASLQNEVRLFLGLDENDIKNKTSRFYQYALALQNSN